MLLSCIDILLSSSLHSSVSKRNGKKKSLGED